MFRLNDRPLSFAALGDRVCFLGGYPLIAGPADDRTRHRQPSAAQAHAVNHRVDGNAASPRSGAVGDGLRFRGDPSSSPGAGDNGNDRDEGTGGSGGNPLSPGGGDARARGPGRRWLCGAFALALLIGSVIAAFRSGPEDVPTSVAEGDFDLARAVEHLRTIAAESHLLGTPEHARL